VNGKTRLIKKDLMRALLLFMIGLAISTGLYAQKEAADSVKQRKVKFAAIPILTYNRTQSLCLGILASAYYKMNQKDTISPSSNTGIMGMYTAEKSSMFFAFHQMYLSQDRWRVRAAVGNMNINFQFYPEDASISVGDFVDYNINADFAAIQVQHKVYRRLYAGLTGMYMGSETTYKLGEQFGGDSTVSSSMNNIGYILTNDTRNFVNYPGQGVFFNFRNQFYRDWTGSDYTFTRYLINYNQFFRLSTDDSKILAVRAACSIASGDVPFEAQTVVGSEDIRGYSQGRYRGDQVYAFQGEYRWNFHKRFGMVGFLGVATAVDKIKDAFSENFLPGIGAGFRYRMIPSEKINVGIDVGFGKDDYSLTFRIGESFAR
jgi:outer membrane protein assembly factor BamA